MLKDEDSCLGVETCLWNKLAFVSFAKAVKSLCVFRRSGRCFDPFITRNREDSLCAVEAPANIARVIATDVCDAHATQLTCVRDPNCAWCVSLFSSLTFLFRYQNELACVIDDYKMAYGISETDLDVLTSSVG